MPCSDLFKMRYHFNGLDRLPGRRRRLNPGTAHHNKNNDLGPPLSKRPHAVLKRQIGSVLFL
jgi:hypothetical protein